MTNDERQRLFAEYERAAKSKPMDLGKMAEVWFKAAGDEILARWLDKLDKDVGGEIDKIQRWARHRYSALGRRAAFGAVQPVLPGFGVGKWSRIATFGVKRQRQPDDSVREFEFSPKTFAQALVNFGRMFAQRRMGSDWEHQALHASTNGRPAPNLCFWDALGVIEEDKVAGLREQSPGPQPDPVALRALLAERFPHEDPDPSGLWARCAEITPLGAQLIPCYEQLSPLFNDEQLDESGEPIGFAVSNISFVNVAHQDGTFFNFGFADRALHPSGSTQEKRMDEKQMMGRLGLAEGATDKEAMRAAFDAYMENTADGPEERKAMKAAFAAKMAAMGDALPAEKIEDKDKDGAAQAAMSAQTQALAALSAKHQQTQTELAALRQREAEREKKEKEQRLAAFSAAACTSFAAGGTGQWDPTKRKDLEDLARDLPEAKWPSLLAGVPKGAFGGASGRLFQGGNPVGAGRGGTGGFNPDYARTCKTTGFSATAQAFASLAAAGVKNPTYQQLRDAIHEVAAGNPDLLRETNTTA